nr:prostaglandin reductase 1-like [Penaeus vannamei]
MVWKGIITGIELQNTWLVGDWYSFTAEYLRMAWRSSYNVFGFLRLYTGLPSGFWLRGPRENQPRGLQAAGGAAAGVREGDVIIEAECLSVDPYMRYRARMIPVGSVMVGGQVARVIESKNLRKVGNTALLHCRKLCNPKEGETVLVNAAAGAVGSAVVQIAKIKGCKVQIASAGSETSAPWVKELGADHVFNYKTANIDEELKKAAPGGIHCYFSTIPHRPRVGDFTLHALRHMVDHARISVCGAISTYNNESKDQGKLVANSPYDTSLIITKQLRIEGFLVNRWLNRWLEGLTQLKQWVQEVSISVGMFFGRSR